MIVLSDSTAKRIAKAIESLNSDDRQFIGITIDERDEWIKALEPMDDPCELCVHEDKAGYERPCNTCVYGHGTTYPRMAPLPRRRERGVFRTACGFEAKP